MLPIRQHLGEDLTFHTHNNPHLENVQLTLNLQRLWYGGAEGLVKLDRAARRLAWHVETLRLHIRTGRLPAVIGSHGVYTSTPRTWRRTRDHDEAGRSPWSSRIRSLSGLGPLSKAS